MINQTIKNNSLLEEKFAKICIDCGTNSTNVITNFMENVVKTGKVPNSNIKPNRTLSALKKISNLLDESEIMAIDKSIKDGVNINNINL